IEADVAEFEQSATEEGVLGNGATGGVAVQTWAVPVAVMSMPAVFPDDIEVQVLDTRDGVRLVAAVELVSPRNKDRPEARRAFAAKCASYLSQGVGLIVVDIVTERTAHLHNEVMALMGQGEPFLFGGDMLVYAAAYRPARPPDGDRVDLWPVPLAV